MSQRIEETRRLLGSCFFAGFDGLELSPETASFLKTNSVAGVTLFGNNYSSPAQVAELVNSIQALRGDVPLFVAVDHEGGRVQRFKKPFTRFPAARVIGDTDSPKLAFDCADVMAKELRTVGVNLAFAPVADINTNPANPVIGDRAFGDNEERVSKFVSAYVRGFLTNHLQCCVKHFPGHGDTSQDSHLALPKVKTSLETLRERELKPFTKAFKARCEFVMTAHVILEAVDPGIPATMSRTLLADVLRGELRYRGIVVSDDMEMKAIADHFGEVDAALKTLEAGVDVLLYHTEPVQTRVFDGLMSKLTSPEGSVAFARLKEASARVTAHRRKHLLPYSAIFIPEIEAVVGSKEHQALAAKLPTPNSR